MKKFYLSVAIAIAATLTGIVVRLGNLHPPSIIATVIFFFALLGAGFLLSWGLESAEKFVSKGLAIAVLALITVLPEYAVDIYYSFQAGRHPGSEYVGFAAANMTGANRLLVGLAWPVIVLLHWWRSKKKNVTLAEANLTEIGFLFLSSLYAFVIVLKNKIDLWDTIILIAIYLIYLWQTGKGSSEEQEAEKEIGPAAALTKLSKQKQYIIITALGVYAAFVILLSAEPFAESLIATGGQLGLNKFLLIQWLAPLASEAPTIIIAILLTIALKPESALSAMISDKINQWTLLVGMIPLAYSIGGGTWGHLPLDARQREEFFLTAAQSLFALSLLLGLKFTLRKGLILLFLFAIQLLIAFIFRNNEVTTIHSLTYLSWLYLFLAFVTGINQRQEIINQVLSLKKALVNR
jgi:cation:H+ antiporter